MSVQMNSQKDLQAKLELWAKGLQAQVTPELPVKPGQ
jgi:hypothetical protein